MMSNKWILFISAGNCNFNFYFYFIYFIFFLYVTSNEEKAIHLTDVGVSSRKSSSHFGVWCIWWVTRGEKQGFSKAIEPEGPGCLYHSPKQPCQGLGSARCSDCFLYHGWLRPYLLQPGAQPNQSPLWDSVTHSDHSTASGYPVMRLVFFFSPMMVEELWKWLQLQVFLVTRLDRGSKNAALEIGGRRQK